MRSLSTVLLLGSVTFLSTITASAAPLSVVEPNDAPNSEVEAFLRSVRIGLLGAHANVEAGSTGSDPLKELEEELRILAAGFGLSHGASSEDGSAKDSDNIAMRPEDEWTVVPAPRLNDMDDIMKKIIITQLEQKDMCEQYTNSFRAQWDRFHDWVRDVFGLSAIDRPACGFQAILDGHINSHVDTPAFAPPSPPRPTKVTSYRAASIAGSPGTRVRGAMVSHGRWQQSEGCWQQRRRPASFTRRLQRAIYSLSPWEGRALAFVVGCGFGVLIRMVYVFIVIGFRWWQNRARDQSDDEEYKELDTSEELEGVVLFDAGSIKNLSLEDLPLYQEKP